MPAQPRPLQRGVYAPVVTPFTDNDEIDFKAYGAQIKRVAEAGVNIVVHGTNGEAIHLDPEERIETIKFAREQLEKLGYGDRPLIAGTGGGSARESIRFSKNAAQAGADYVMVIAPAYFAGIWGKNPDAVYQFFTTVADSSPVPVIIYNFPAVAGGLDLDSDHLIRLAEHQNIVGVKLTCASISKGLRVAAHTKTAEYKQRHPKPYFVLSGKVDYIFPALVGQHDGCITALANVAPKSCAKMFKVADEAIETLDRAKWNEAQELQAKISPMDWANGKTGIAGLKYALDYHIGPLGGKPRTPLVSPGDAVKKTIETSLVPIIEYEKSL